MGSLAQTLFSFDAWSRNCATRTLRQTRLETHAFETAQAHISRVTQGRCQFFADRPSLLDRFGYSDAMLGTTRFQLLNWRAGDVECSTATTRAEDLILYVPLQGSFEARHAGRSTLIEPGQIFFVGSSGGSSRRWLGSSALLNIIIPRKTVTRLLAGDLGIAACEPFMFPAAGSLSTPKTETLCRLLETITSDLASTHSLFSHAGAGAHMERVLLHALIRSMPHNYSGVLREAERRPTAPPYLRRVESFIRDHIGESLDINKLVRVGGVSTRTLHYGFRRFRQTTPQRYIKTLRLNLARDALLAAGDRPVKISDVAVRFGYENAAQFSKDYRNTFRMSPRETLRQGRGSVVEFDECGAA